MQSIINIAKLSVLVALATGCSQTDKAAPTSNALQTGIVQQPLVSSAPKIAKITAKGGTKIAVLVNKNPITTNQIKRRVAFVKLRRIKGNANSIATNELIDESIKMQEARRIRAVATEPEVTAAYARFAKNNQMPVSRLNSLLSARGVTECGFKDFIKASLSWRRAVAARVRADAQGITSEQGTNTPAWLPPAGQTSSKELEYTIQQIVFVVPPDKRSSQLSKRRLQAKRFRANINGCENARTLAAGLKDVTVLDRGRFLEAKLPPRWIKDIRVTPPGNVTRTQDGPQGVEMIAVCKKRQVVGEATNAQKELFTDGKFQEKASTTETSYFKELKDRAVIERR